MIYFSPASAGSGLSINDISMASGPVKGVSFDGNVVRISEDLCAGLASGEVISILVTYLLSGRFGSEIPKTAIFNLSRTNDGPVISSHIVREPVLSQGTACFDLLSDYAS